MDCGINGEVPFVLSQPLELTRNKDGPMKMRAGFLSLSILIGACSPLLAQSGAPDSENGRFSFTPVSEGMLRLDTRTGQVSLCSNKGSGWACQTVPDERAALENEIVRLQNENGSLKRAMIARGVPLPGGLTEDSAKTGPHIELKLPSDADVERVMSFLEKVWRRLLDMVQSMQKEVEKKG
jgi:hypothetical protein